MLIHKFGYKGKRTTKNMNLWDALRMGFFQLLALLPGVSRSGSTLTGGMLGGLDQKAARDFSFFMFMPVSFGAIILKLKHFFNKFNCRCIMASIFNQLYCQWNRYLFST